MQPVSFYIPIAAASPTWFRLAVGAIPESSRAAGSTMCPSRNHSPHSNKQDGSRRIRLVATGSKRRLFPIEIIQRPLILPGDHRETLLVKINRQPNIPRIARMFRAPDIRHEDIGILEARHFQHKRTLPAERQIGAITPHRRVQGPQILSAVNKRARLGFHPVQPEVIIQ